VEGLRVAQGVRGGTGTPATATIIAARHGGDAISAADGSCVEEGASVSVVGVLNAVGAIHLLLRAFWRAPGGSLLSSSSIGIAWGGDGRMGLWEGGPGPGVWGGDGRRNFPRIRIPLPRSGLPRSGSSRLVEEIDE